MKLGLNSVLYFGFDLETAFRGAAMAGYDGIELSAIPAKEHLELARWKELVEPIGNLSATYGLDLISIEQPRPDLERMEQTFQAAADLAIPIVNCGPGGISDDEDSFQESMEKLTKLTSRAEHFGVTLCVKAHVKQAVYNTPTTLRMLQTIDSPALGLNLDPSHIHRSGENPLEAIDSVMPRLRHIHIRDCLGRQPDPGKPEDQTNGRGDIDLIAFFRLLHENGYDGPVDLEVIGTEGYEVLQCQTIAAEARGHMQACLQACGAR